MRRRTMQSRSHLQRATLPVASCAALAVLCSMGCGSSTPTAGPESGTGGAAGMTAGSGNGGNAGTSGGTLIIGTGGSGTDGGTSSDGAQTDATGCGQSSIQASSKVVDILLVIDKSGSMTSTPAGFATDKWTAMKTALAASLDQVKGGISFGVELFPNNLTTPIPTSCTSQCWDMPTGESAILVTVGPGTTTVPAILAKLDIMPAGGTPTAVALKAASDYFLTGTGKDLPGDKYVLLATDGGPNGNNITCTAQTCTTNMDNGVFTSNFCEASPNIPDAPRSCLDDTSTTDQLATMAAAGIKTFVVGIPGTDPYISTLDAMAVAGGAPASAMSPKYFAVSASGGVAGLQQVFESITKQLIKSCRLQLQSVPPDLGLLNVYVDGTVIPKAGADGWNVDTTTSPPTVVLEGATCTQIETSGANKVEIQYGCPTVDVR